MTTILSPQALPSLPVLNHENIASYTNGNVEKEPPERGTRLAHSESLGDLLTQNNSNRSEFSAPAQSLTSVELNGASARRANASVSFVEEQSNGTGASGRPQGQLLRANTEGNLRRRSPSAGHSASEENWEMRHGWEDQYNSSEYLGLLSSVSLYFCAIKYLADVLYD